MRSDEAGGKTPWELFDEDDAQQALAFAEEALKLTKGLVTSYQSSDDE